MGSQPCPPQSSERLRAAQVPYTPGAGEHEDLQWYPGELGRIVEHLQFP
jgi:hypothetical protein